MKINHILKRIFCAGLAASVLVALSSCAADENEFTRNSEGNLISYTGEEYAFLASEGAIYYLGELEFVGSVQGEEKESQHLYLTYQTGMFSIKGDETKNVLVRHAPDDEWFSIYRKTSLPPFDYSVDNCSRLELISWAEHEENEVFHATCGDGIDDPSEIAEFLADVRSQKTSDEAGLYDLVRNSDGRLENCRIGAVICGYFDEEPYLSRVMYVTSYNDLAYSVSMDGRDYVLPEKWVEKLRGD